VTDWISIQERGHPNFNVHGFHLGQQKIQFRTEDGEEHEDIYQGWGLYGKRDRQDVTHWRPLTGDAVVLGESTDHDGQDPDDK